MKSFPKRKLSVTEKKYLQISMWEKMEMIIQNNKSNSVLLNQMFVQHIKFLICLFSCFKVYFVTTGFLYIYPFHTIFKCKFTTKLCYASFLCLTVLNKTLLHVVALLSVLGVKWWPLTNIEDILESKTSFASLIFRGAKIKPPLKFSWC